ncbi:T9SS type A sorting domain-containing protein [candidate division WOR-3 bacterium]|nr:T9SS type A sorting domain-containing protein [candidate division WOR-3 bacterium]
MTFEEVTIALAARLDEAGIPYMLTGALAGPVRPRPDDMSLRCMTASVFKNDMQLAYSVGSPGSINLGVYDAQGRCAKQLAVGPQAAGTHTASWDGCDEQNRRLPAGAYFCRLESGSQQQTRKLALTE